MEGKDLENDSLKTILGCVSFGRKLLCTLKHSCSLFEECSARVIKAEVNRDWVGVMKVIDIAHGASDNEGECIQKGTEA